MSAFSSMWKTIHCSQYKQEWRYLKALRSRCVGREECVRTWTHSIKQYITAPCHCFSFPISLCFLDAILDFFRNPDQSTPGIVASLWSSRRDSHLSGISTVSLVSMPSSLNNESIFHPVFIPFDLIRSYAYEFIVL